ncbi:Plus agglutinin, related [Neospora caninum Liverpool]|uniref:Plus agglutinin, related n=1 Tax=Neospora caninum (strain Liverpool) TaxID=572307 RepID=F0VMI7_NEOCL|nr:Plus agglutinin, related [Neospora caninum Liverpool]CBZ54933.1 Plus agglutinin, related [Neospora caninum Liverpool]CEL69655.1 TPA: Plus agglutinin, related [Neospora caninum Liverpool]|eukprot:XP_003884961.1 Plus agglutinin, related [Neospora caninum Liverpool]
MAHRAFLVGAAIFSALPFYSTGLNSSDPAPYEDTFDVLLRTDPTVTPESHSEGDGPVNGPEVDAPLQASGTAPANFSFRGSDTTTKERGKTGQQGSEQNVDEISSDSSQEDASPIDEDLALQTLNDLFTKLATGSSSPYDLASQLLREGDETPQGENSPPEEPTPVPQDEPTPVPQDEVAPVTEVRRLKATEVAPGEEADPDQEKLSYPTLDEVQQTLGESGEDDQIPVPQALVLPPFDETPQGENSPPEEPTPVPQNEPTPVPQDEVAPVTEVRRLKATEVAPGEEADPDQEKLSYPTLEEVQQTLGESGEDDQIPVPQALVLPPFDETPQGGNSPPEEPTPVPQDEPTPVPQDEVAPVTEVRRLKATEVAPGEEANPDQEKLSYPTLEEVQQTLGESGEDDQIPVPQALVLPPFDETPQGENSPPEEPTPVPQDEPTPVPQDEVAPVTEVRRLKATEVAPGEEANPDQEKLSYPTLEEVQQTLGESGEDDQIPVPQALVLPPFDETPQGENSQPEEPTPVPQDEPTPVPQDEVAPVTEVGTLKATEVAPGEEADPDQEKLSYPTLDEVQQTLGESGEDDQIPVPQALVLPPFDETPQGGNSPPEEPTPVPQDEPTPVPQDEPTPVPQDEVAPVTEVGTLKATEVAPGEEADPDQEKLSYPTLDEVQQTLGESGEDDQIPVPQALVLPPFDETPQGGNSPPEEPTPVPQDEPTPVPQDEVAPVTEVGTLKATEVAPGEEADPDQEKLSYPTLDEVQQTLGESGEDDQIPVPQALVLPPFDETPQGENSPPEEPTPVPQDEVAPVTEVRRLKATEVAPGEEADPDQEKLSYPTLDEVQQTLGESGEDDQIPVPQALVLPPFDETPQGENSPPEEPTPVPQDEPTPVPQDEVAPVTEVRRLKATEVAPGEEADPDQEKLSYPTLDEVQQTLGESGEDDQIPVPQALVLPPFDETPQGENSQPEEPTPVPQDEVAPVTEVRRLKATEVAPGEEADPDQEKLSYPTLDEVQQTLGESGEDDQIPVPQALVLPPFDETPQGGNSPPEEPTPVPQDEPTPVPQDEVAPVTEVRRLKATEVAPGEEADPDQEKLSYPTLEEVQQTLGESGEDDQIPVPQALASASLDETPEAEDASPEDGASEDSSREEPTEGEDGFNPLWWL